MKQFLFLSILLLNCLTIASYCEAKGEEAVSLEMKQYSAVVIRDSFNEDRWGDVWNSDWIQDKNLRVYCENGQLRITGVSGDPVPVCKDHHEFRFTGLVSKPTIARDVVLACKMQVNAPLPTGKTRIRYLAHLCGANPDYFFDTGLAHEPDGREGWLHAPIGYGYPFSHDHHYPFVSLEEIPADKEYTITVIHNASSKMTEGFVVDGTKWRSLGEHRVFLSTTQVELKVDVPYDGVRVDVAFDDMRIYLRPEVAPVRLVLIKPPFPGFPFPGATIAIEDEAGKVVAEGETDLDGEATLTLPSNRLYPMGGSINIQYEGKTVGTGEINASGIDGLYPGDIWKIHAPKAFQSKENGYPIGM